MKFLTSLIFTAALATTTTNANSLFEDLRQVKNTFKISSSLTQLLLNTDRSKLDSLAYGLCIQAGEPLHECRRVGDFAEVLCVIAGHPIQTCLLRTGLIIGGNPMAKAKGIGWGLCTMKEKPSRCSSFDSAKSDLSWALCLFAGNEIHRCTTNQP